MNLAEAIADTMVERADHFDCLASTNDRALELTAGLSSTTLPYLIVADRQTAGRGRGRNRWFAEDGVLTFSLIVEPARWRLDRGLWPRLSVAVGGAVAEALAQWSLRDRPLLKWPNDVLIQGRKVAGILNETDAAAPDRLVIGIGVNVATSFLGAPEDVRARATSLSQHGRGVAPDRHEVLRQILWQLDLDFRALGEHSPALVDRWRRHCALTGRLISVGDGERRVSGACLGLEDDASLLVRSERGPERCYSGTVTMLD